MIEKLRNGASGMASPGKTQRVFLDNINILRTLSGKAAEGAIRETFLYNQMWVNHQVSASKSAGFEICGSASEVGESVKGQSRL